MKKIEIIEIKVFFKQKLNLLEKKKIQKYNYFVKNLFELQINTLFK
jgi:hypothetical protein